MHEDLSRGFNPEPAGGWPWHLTDYEVAYITKYRVRPVRDWSWSHAERDEKRLDAEAEGVLSDFSLTTSDEQPAEPSTEPESVIRAAQSTSPRMPRDPFLITTGILILIVIVLGVFTVGFLSNTKSSAAEIDRLERSLDLQQRSQQDIIDHFVEYGFNDPVF